MGKFLYDQGGRGFDVRLRYSISWRSGIQEIGQAHPCQINIIIGLVKVLQKAQDTVLDTAD